jgi:hypothetical protein
MSIEKFSVSRRDTGRLTIQWASMDCNNDSFTLFIYAYTVNLAVIMTDWDRVCGSSDLFVLAYAKKLRDILRFKQRLLYDYFKA